MLYNLNKCLFILFGVMTRVNKISHDELLKEYSRNISSYLMVKTCLRGQNTTVEMCLRFEGIIEYKIDKLVIQIT